MAIAGQLPAQVASVFVSRGCVRDGGAWLWWWKPARHKEFRFGSAPAARPESLVRHRLSVLPRRWARPLRLRYRSAPGPIFRIPTFHAASDGCAAVIDLHDGSCAPQTGLPDD